MRDRSQLEFIKRLAYYLDSAIPIPGTKMRIGLDPIIGLIPGVGDAVTSLISTYIVLTAMQLKVSRWTLVRMVFNIVIESVVGIIPIVGDFFDAYWKSNERNRILLEKNMANPAAKSADMLFIIFTVLVLIAILIGTGWAAIALVQWIVSQF
ncbi:MAG: DUF4112 domain-containing protein [Proteobacteria bacterium]|nr:MAG: DUF4112 domain-containing protein [Pseudomonadota bacterium]